MKIKMLVFDLDDTLLRNDKTISDRTASTIMKCRDMGIKVVYVYAQQLFPSKEQCIAPRLKNIVYACI